jgi:hypothetical protein
MPKRACNNSEKSIFSWQAIMRDSSVLNDEFTTKNRRKIISRYGRIVE